MRESSEFLVFHIRIPYLNYKSILLKYLSKIQLLSPDMTIHGNVVFRRSMLWNFESASIALMAPGTFPIIEKSIRVSHFFSATYATVGLAFPARLSRTQHRTCQLFRGSINLGRKRSRGSSGSCHESFFNAAAVQLAIHRSYACLRRSLPSMTSGLWYPACGHCAFPRIHGCIGQDA